VTITLLTGDCRNVLPTLPSNSVHCVVTSPPYYALRSYLDASHPDKHRELGSEATPDEYLAAMVGVFREVRRVLRPDGTCWVNIGDSYATSFFSHDSIRSVPQPLGDWSKEGQRLPKAERSRRGSAESLGGLKAKDLILMPARLALALQADGWWVRSAIVWAKPNPMPESCQDRPTSAYEMVYLLTKAARYYYDQEAIREPVSQYRYDGKPTWVPLCDDGARAKGGPTQAIRHYAETKGANARNWWVIPTHAFPEAHFATYPPELVERCIRAGTSERGCCAACGAPYVRQMQATGGILGKSWHDHSADKVKGNAAFGIGNAARDGRAPEYQRTTTGWRASCQCSADVQPCTVLDPFLGSGTTALVADRLQRHCIGIDLSLTYADMAQRRIEQDCPLFTSWAPAEDPEDERMRDLFAEAAE
jgi:DNA modification methylase